MDASKKREKYALGFALFFAMYVLTMIVLALIGFGYDAARLPIRPAVYPEHSLIYGLALFAVPYATCAYYCGRTFKDERKHALALFSSLFLTEKLGLYIVSAGFYSINIFDYEQIFYRTSDGGDALLQFFTLRNAALGFAGYLALCAWLLLKTSPRKG